MPVPTNPSSSDRPRPHETNTDDYRPTPHPSKSRPPSEGELSTYQNGPERFLNLARLGSFRVWDLEDLYPGIIIEMWNFNCFAWATGHTDRWLQGGSVAQMTDLYTKYHFRQCEPAEAEVELYRIVDAPPTLTNRRGAEYANAEAPVQHAHRRDRAELDASPRLGCSSKQGALTLFAHNRMGLVDARPYGSRAPKIQYGSLYQYWRRTPEHPSFPGQKSNTVPRGHYPHDKIFEYGEGKNPPGHPGNDMGLPNPRHGNNQPSQSESAGGNNTRPVAAPAQRMTQAASGSAHRASHTSQASSGPTRGYASVSQMEAHDAIPPPNEAAQKSAISAYKKFTRSNRAVVKSFEDRFEAWRKTWYMPVRASSSDANVRCKVPEFEKLLEMGPKILPLIVCKLLDGKNFTAVFLYNALERNTKYLIDPSDVLNFLVLQRQNNLIIDINQDRQWAM